MKYEIINITRKYFESIFSKVELYYKEESNSLYLKYILKDLIFSLKDLNSIKLNFRKELFRNYPTLGLIISDNDDYFTPGYKKEIELIFDTNDYDIIFKLNNYTEKELNNYIGFEDKSVYKEFNSMYYNNMTSKENFNLQIDTVIPCNSNWNEIFSNQDGKIAA